jgi:hypothetical protein
MGSLEMRIRDGTVYDLRWRNKALAFYTRLFAGNDSNGRGERVQVKLGGVLGVCVFLVPIPFQGHLPLFRS